MRTFNRFALAAMVISAVFVWGAAASVKADLIHVGFHEAMDSSLQHTTDQVHSSDNGITPGTEFTVDKFVHNISGTSWSGFNIQLLSLQNGQFLPSPPSDGISFDDPKSFPDWLATVSVDINGRDQTGWSVTRDTTNDSLHFNFNSFVVNDGDTLSLHFNMSENADNTWELQQGVPEIDPNGIASALTLLFGGMAVMKRRKLAV